MSYKRPALLSARPDDINFTRAMAGVGMNFASEADYSADIEVTLLHASLLGMEEHDLRVLSVLSTWLGVHHRHLNVDRLIRGARELTSQRARGYWAAVATWLTQDRRFHRLLSLHEGAPVELLQVGSAFQITRHGEDERFKGSALLVPKGALRDRVVDVLTPVTLAQRHPVYRGRVLMGPSWRADVWVALEQNPNVSVSELARRVGCSFATAWQVAQDYSVLYPTS